MYKNDTCYDQEAKRELYRNLNSTLRIAREFFLGNKSKSDFI